MSERSYDMLVAAVLHSGLCDKEVEDSVEEPVAPTWEETMDEDLPAEYQAISTAISAIKGKIEQAINHSKLALFMATEGLVLEVSIETSEVLLTDVMLRKRRA